MKSLFLIPTDLSYLDVLNKKRQTAQHLCRDESHLVEEDAPVLQSPGLMPSCWLKLNQLRLTSEIAIIAAPAGEKHTRQH